MQFRATLTPPPSTFGKRPRNFAFFKFHHRIWGKRRKFADSDSFSAHVHDGTAEKSDDFKNFRGKNLPAAVVFMVRGGRGRTFWKTNSNSRGRDERGRESPPNLVCIMQSRGRGKEEGGGLCNQGGEKRRCMLFADGGKRKKKLFLSPFPPLQFYLKRIVANIFLPFLPTRDVLWGKSRGALFALPPPSLCFPSLLLSGIFCTFHPTLPFPL